MYQSVVCLNCTTEFQKSKTEIKNSPNHFCSRSCSATYNNKKYPKRSKVKKCLFCSELIKKSSKFCSQECFIKYKKSNSNIENICIDCGKQCKGKQFCRKCYLSNKSKIDNKKCKTCGTKITGAITCRSCYLNSKSQKTLGEVIYEKHHQSSAYALVRTRARAKAKKLGWNTCITCGYDKHIEIAHKKPISDFSLDTLVDDINHENNLLPLCPNCHWEFDNGLLNL